MENEKWKMDTTFSKIEYTLTADLADLAKYYQQWRLKPSTSKTVTSVFYLRNIRSRRELDVQINGQWCQFTSDPVIQGTLDTHCC